MARYLCHPLGKGDLVCSAKGHPLRKGKKKTPGMRFVRKKRRQRRAFRRGETLENIHHLPASYFPLRRAILVARGRRPVS